MPEIIKPVMLEEHGNRIEAKIDRLIDMLNSEVTEAESEHQYKNSYLPNNDIEMAWKVKYQTLTEEFHESVMLVTGETIVKAVDIHQAVDRTFEKIKLLGLGKIYIQSAELYNKPEDV